MERMGRRNKRASLENDNAISALSGALKGLESKESPLRRCIAALGDILAPVIHQPTTSSLTSWLSRCNKASYVRLIVCITRGRGGNGRSICDLLPGIN